MTCVLVCSMNTLVARYSSYVRVYVASLTVFNACAFFRSRRRANLALQSSHSVLRCLLLRTSFEGTFFPIEIEKMILEIRFF